MSGRTLAAVLLRVWGVVLIVGSVASAGAVFLLLAPGAEMNAAAYRATAIGSFLQVLVSLVAGIYLLRNGDRVAGWLVSDLEEPADQPLTPAVIEGIGVRLLAIYLIVAGGRELIADLAEALTTKEVVHLNGLIVGRAVGGLVELIAGMVLLWKREQIVAALSRGWRVIRARDDAED